MTRSVIAWLRRHLGLLLLLTGAATVYVSTRASYGMFMWDEAEYASIARSLLRGEGFAIGGHPNHLRPPVLPLASAASMWLSGKADDSSAKLATLGFTLLALTIVYACTAAAYDTTTALGAAFVLATIPELWTMTANFLSEVPFLAFFAGAILWFELGLRRHRRYFWASSLCFALALLTRYTAVLFAPFVLLRLAFSALARRDDEWQRMRTPAFVLAPFGAAMLIAPWLVRQQSTFGDFLIGFKSASMQLQVYLPGVSMPWYYYLVRLPEMLSPAITALLVVGIVWGVWQRHGMTLVCTLVIGGLLVWFSSYRYKEVRLATSILPFVAVVAAAGPTQILLDVRWRSYGRWLLPGLGVLVFAWNNSLVQPLFATRITLGYPPMLQAMRFLKDHSWPEAVVMTASTPQVAWYSDRRVVDFPEKSELATALAAAEWVVITNFERGQQAYVQDLAKRLLRVNAPTEVFPFHDQRFAVLVVRAAFLREQLGGL
jgi:4-amino-4-deoxy-L-arabinose transferase-like glycosyltransferase